MLYYGTSLWYMIVETFLSKSEVLGDGLLHPCGSLQLPLRGHRSGLGSEFGHLPLRQQPGPPFLTGTLVRDVCVAVGDREVLVILVILELRHAVLPCGQHASLPKRVLMGRLACCFVFGH